MKSFISLIVLSLVSIAYGQDPHVTIKANGQTVASGWIHMDPVTVAITPTSPVVDSQGTLQLGADVQYAQDTSVTWTTTVGSIDSTGLYTAPVVLTGQTATVTATSKEDTTKSAQVSLIIKAVVSISISPAASTLTVGQQQQFTAQVGGAANTGVAWVLSGAVGTLTQTGLLTGAFVGTGKVTVNSIQDPTVFASATVNVIAAPPPPPPAATTDGPAQLPLAYVKSNLTDTPAPGAVIHVQAGTENAAYAAAKCGDTLMIDPNSNWPAPKFTKNCDSTHWIIIRPDVSDLLLPAEHSHLTPCYAGLASLPGRPTYPCPAPLTRVIPRFTLTTGQQVVVSGSYHRFLGIETVQLSGAFVNTYWQVTGNHLVFDRTWTRGAPTDESKHGFYLDGSSNVAIVDSYLTDIHCKSLGTCSEAHGIIGVAAAGPYKITGNFIEASSEGVFFGGGTSAVRPMDIEVTKNHFFKPLTWNPLHPTYGGIPFIVKNHFELKDAQRVLFEGNILENDWGGYSQAGYPIALTPKNPGAIVKDITIRFNYIINAGGAFQIANIAQAVTGTVSAGGLNYSIHDVIVDNSHNQYCYKCSAHFMQINGVPTEQLTSLSVKHITYLGLPDKTFGAMMIVGPAVNISVIDSIIEIPKYGPWSIGGITNCAYNLTKPVEVFNACFIPHTITGNIFPRGLLCPNCSLLVGGQKVPQWPAGNLFPADNAGVGYMDLTGGDYHLAPTSIYKGKATDGKDPGADVDSVMNKLVGVQ